MNENFIKLKDDLNNILTKVSKSPSYYYNNWITKIVIIGGFDICINKRKRNDK